MSLNWIYKGLYSLAVRAYVGGIYLAQPFLHKAKQMIEGRRDVLQAVQAKRGSNERWIWIHVASLGEFEQARPIIEKIRLQHPEYRLCLTFFSPSGYEPMKHYPNADLVTYLPFDTSLDVEPFIDALQPEMVLFVKYEFWLRTLAILKKKRVPTYLVSAIFRKEQSFFKKGYGALFREALTTFRTIFVQDNQSVELLRSINVTNTMVTGDTRIDRVAKIKQEEFSLPPIQKLQEAAHKRGQKVVIMGSSWPEDEELMGSFLKQNSEKAFFIVVPHEIGEAHIRSIVALTSGRATRYSEWNGEAADEVELLIIDKIGLLSKLYRYADIAYIGGGFGKGIHNTLEPAVYGLPVLFGPKYHKFREAVELIKVGGGFSVSNPEEMHKVMDRLLTDDAFLASSSRASAQWIGEQLGATDTLLSALFPQHSA